MKNIQSVETVDSLKQVKRRPGLDPRDLGQVQAWMADRGDFDLPAFTLSSISVTEAAVLSTLFWPKFVEFQEYVFLEFVFTEPGFQIWIRELDGDSKAVESMVNRIHLWDFFVPTADSEYLAISEMANRMAEMWKCVLRKDFPDREFAVTVKDDPEEYGPTLSVHSL